MAFRTVVISTKGKLEYSLNYIIFRNEEIKKILITEVSTLILQNTGISMTAVLISELIKRKIKIIFCDEKQNPVGEVIPYASSFESSKRIKYQINWNNQTKNKLWTEIIKVKIINQALILKINGYEEKSLNLIEYANNVLDGDSSNREGHAAKVYFNALFGNDFKRGRNDDFYNVLLNYGYSIILSAINREISAFGYLTQLGIHHIGENNPFNLTCDFMEPLRPLIDYYVTKENLTKEDYKSIFSRILSRPVIYNGLNTYLDNAIHLYVANLLAYLNNETCELNFIEYGI